MKLTNWVRDTFVRSVGNELPPVEMHRAEVQERFINAMPPEIQAIARNPELCKHLVRNSVWTHMAHYGVIIGDLHEKEVLKSYHEAADLRKNALAKVRNVAYSCSTLKQLQTQLPDLIKHMPSEKEPIKVNLPMVTGVMEDLKKAGFPGVSK